MAVTRKRRAEELERREDALRQRAAWARGEDRDVLHAEAERLKSLRMAIRR